MKRPPEADQDAASHRGERAVRRVWAVLLVTGALVCGFMWCAEPWQRSGYFRVVPEWVYLALACLCGGGLALMAAGGDRKRWRRALVVGVGGLALLGGMRGFFGTMARSDLLRRLHFESTHTPGILHPDDETKPLSAKLVEALEGLKIGAPIWLKEHAERRSRIVPPLTENLIARSRWSTREALAEAIIRDDALAAYLMRDWKRLFPAIIGADVDLKHRRDWMECLDGLRRDESPASQAAALHCMALIVLTDPPEFETWRVTARDAMLGWKHPLPAGHEAMWMRTVDTLLAPDPPETWMDLAKPLIATPESFRYAMLAPVRGVAGHFEELKREFEDFERRNMTEHGFALWHGVGESLKHWPYLFDQQQTERMQNWRRDVLFRWLMDHSRGTRQELSDTRGRVLLSLTPRQQSELAASAMDWARMACEEVGAAKAGADLRERRAFMIFCLILPYLNEQQQAEAGRQLIPVMLRPDLFVIRDSPRGSVRFDLSGAEMLWKIRPLMNEEERRALQVSLTPLMQRLFPRDRSEALLLCLDAWSDRPALTPEKWLALAWHARHGWRIVPANEPLPAFDLFANEPLPIPPVPEQAVESLARIVEDAWANRNNGTKGFSNRLHQGLDGFNTTSPTVLSISRMTESRITEWRYSSILHAQPVARMLKFQLHLAGLYRLEDREVDTLRELAGSRMSAFYHYPSTYRAKHPANPWTNAFQDAQTAAQEVDRLVGHARQSWALNDLVFWMETSPPEADVVHAIWDALGRKSHHGGFDDRRLVFGTLFRMCHLLPREETLAMRRDYLIATRAVGFAWNDFNDLDPWSAPWDPLQYPGGGIGIPWEEDELSAVKSWTTQFGRLTHFTPDESNKTNANSAFRYLALGVFPMYEIDLRKTNYDRVRMSPLSAPFEASPWQKARELHLRRPDLRIR